MTYSYFIIGEDVLIEKDFKKITQEYNVDYVVAGSNLEYPLSIFLWRDNPKIVWFQDFKASIENKTRMRGYDFITKSKIPLKDRLRISASFDRFTNKTYENYIFVSMKDEPLNFKIEKCYEILCVHNSSDFYRSMNSSSTP